MPTIIALTGPSGSGKSTLAQELSLRRNFIKKPFAENLKSMLRTFLTRQGCDFVTANRMLEGDLKEEPTQAFCGKTPRYAMQTLGTEWREMLGRDLWINGWELEVTAIWARLPDIGIVVDDLRFPHEAARVRKLNGLVVEIRRPRVIPDSSHVSERMFGLLQPDFVIHNVSKPGDMLETLEAQLRLFSTGVS